MQDLRNTQSKNKTPNKKIAISRAILGLLWSYRYVGLILFAVFIVYQIIFNPASVATVIGTWVNDFIGTLVNTIDY